MTGIIYAYRNKINGKHYVGQTVRPKHRHREHMNGTKNNHSWKFKAAIKKYGPENFIYEVLVDEVPSEDLDDWERYFVWLLRSHSKGYNLTLGGDFDRVNRNLPGFMRRNSAALRAVWLRPGYREEMGAKIRAAASRPEVKQKKSVSLRLSHSKPETKAKMKASAGRVQWALESRVLRSKPIICVETGEWFMNTYEVKRKHGFDNGSINRVCNGKKKRVGGYHWRFATPEENEVHLRRINE